MTHWRYLLIWPGVCCKFGITGAADLGHYVAQHYRDEIRWWGDPVVNHWLADDKQAAATWETGINTWARTKGLKWTHPTRHKAPEWGLHGEWCSPAAADDLQVVCTYAAHSSVQPVLR